DRVPDMEKDHFHGELKSFIYHDEASGNDISCKASKIDDDFTIPRSSCSFDEILEASPQCKVVKPAKMVMLNVKVMMDSPCCRDFNDPNDHGVMDLAGS